MRLSTNLSFEELRILFKLEWYDSMAPFVFWPAYGMRRAVAHHIGVLDLQVSFMYFMNATARGLVFVIVSSCRTA